MEDNTRITRKEAARMLGVSAQTVTNLARRGALTVSKIGRFQYFSRDEVVALVPQCGGIRDTEAAISAVDWELKEVLSRAVSENRIQRARFEFLSNIEGGTHTLNNFADVALGLYRALLACADDDARITDREDLVIADTIKLVPDYVTADRLDLTIERVRQIRNRAIRRVIGFSQDTRRNYETMRKARDEAAAEARRLVEENGRLLSENRRLRDMKGVPSDDGAFFKTDIRDLPFSTRLVNHLKAACIDTVADLLKWRRRDIARIRNLGFKSLKELDAWMDANGLSYEMKLNRQQRL